MHCKQHTVQWFTVLAHVCVIVLPTVVLARPPNIVFIFADDYGWNDVGYHGSEIRTPTLDQLAADGVKLERYYVQPICTPSRSQFMSGRYQIHTGLQHGVLLQQQRNGLPLSDATIADKLREAGYATHMVGKWHIGFFRKEYTPTYRGFDSFYGYYGGREDYYNHSELNGLDLHDNLVADWNQTGVYSAHLFAKKAENIAIKHATDSPSKPLFLYLPFQSAHAPAQAPDHYTKPYAFIKNNDRRIYAGMVAAMDEAIANITTIFKEQGLWNNTLLVFSTDNGAPTERGNNWPLRGVKDSLWEGGVRGVGFVSGPALPAQACGQVNQQLIHVSDWFPTLLHLAGGSTSGLKLDGFNVWDAISQDKPSPRKELLHNIDPMSPAIGEPLYPNTFDTRIRAAIRVDNWKLLTGSPGNGNWYPPPTSMFQQHSASNLVSDDANKKNVWLFDIIKDPYEKVDLSDKYPGTVRFLLDRLAHYNATAVPVRYPALDPAADPLKHGGVWQPWVD